MTTYNTGNPIGSTEVKDLYDNAQNFDTLANTTTLETVPDRRGVPRLTLHGFEQEAKRRFESIKFQPPIPYAPGIEVTTSSLTVDYLGVLYYALPSGLPFTTGAWNPAQWSPLQNTNPGNELLVFDDYAAASAAAASLPDGQEVEAPNVDGRISRFDVQSGTLVYKSLAADAESTSFNPAGAGAISRTVQDKMREWVSVKDFGAVGDGVTSASAALNLAGVNSPEGSTLEFEHGKTYLLDSPVVFESPHRLKLNGATIKTAANVTGTAVFFGKQKATYTTFTPFTVTKDAMIITIPSGVVVEAGDLIKLNSSTERITGYYHGQYSAVVEVTGSSAFLRTPIYDTFTVNTITVYKGYPAMVVEDGVVDVSAVPNIPNSAGALSIIGTNIRLDNVRVIGNEYACVGARVDGDGAILDNCHAYKFLNSNGMVSGGRVGYGFLLQANHSIARGCTAVDCKHGFTSASRREVIVNITLENSFGYESSADLVAFAGTFDFHSNVAGVININNCRGIGARKLFNIRTLNPVNINGGEYMQRASGLMFDGFEVPLSNITIKGMKYRLYNNGSALFKVTSATLSTLRSLNNIQIIDCESLSDVGALIINDSECELNDVRIDGTKHTGSSIIRHTAGNINRLQIRNNSGFVTASAVRIQMDGAYSINGLDIDDNKLYRSNTANNEPIVHIISTHSINRISANSVAIEGNLFKHANDTGTGYSIQLQKLALTNHKLVDNVIERGSFRCIQYQGCTIDRGVLQSNVIDGSFLVNNVVPTVLNRVTVIGNVGESYVVSAGDAGITKTNYVDGLNNFTTYTP